MKITRYFFAYSLTLLTLGGCALSPDFNPVSMSKEAENQSNFLEQYQINTILHNIMRSAHNEPLTFMRVNGVAGSWSDSLSNEAGTKIGQPAPDSPFGSLDPIGISASRNGQNGGNYSIDVADDSVYSSVFLNPVPTKYIEFFVDNHKPKTLVYSLLIDRIIISEEGKKDITYDNNPLLNSYENFHKKLYEMISLGLTADENIIIESIGKPASLEAIKQKYGPYYKQTLAKQGITLVSVSAPKGNLFQLIKKTKGTTRMCIPRNPATESQVGRDFGPSMFCSPATDETTAITELSESRKTQIVFRSTSGIFDFLGEVALAGLQDPPYVVSLPPLDPQDKFRFPKEDKDYVLLNVKRVNFFSNDNYAQITTRRGLKYAIPDQEAGYSRMTIRLVSQIMKLNAIPGDAYSRAPQPLLIQTIPSQGLVGARIR